MYIAYLWSDRREHIEKAAVLYGDKTRNGKIGARISKSRPARTAFIFGKFYAQ